MRPQFVVYNLWAACGANAARAVTYSAASGSAAK